MARKIIWSSRAKKSFSDILEYYSERNQNNNYSLRILNDINNRVNLLTRFPFLGTKTNWRNYRVLIKSHYSIYYEILPDEILILFIWDSRQNPEELIIK